MFNFRKELAHQILSTDNPIESLNKVERVFIKNNIPTKIDEETGILFYQSSEISSINSENGIKFDAYMR